MCISFFPTNALIQGISALMAVSTTGDVEVARLLLAAPGIDIYYKDNQVLKKTHTHTNTQHEHTFT
jgi:hypothetical protein